MEPQLKSDILLLQQDDGVWAYRTFLPQQDGEAWAYHLWEVLFRWSASRLDLEKFSGMLHVWESRMVLYVFNVPRLHKHSQQVDGLRFLLAHLPRTRKKTRYCFWKWRSSLSRFPLRECTLPVAKGMVTCAQSHRESRICFEVMLTSNIPRLFQSSVRKKDKKPQNRRMQKLTAPRGLPRRSPTLVLTGPCAA